MTIQPFLRTGVSLPDAWSAPATLRQMFTTRFDFLAVPKKTFISWLSHFTSNHDHTERLREFCSSDGQVLLALGG